MAALSGLFKTVISFAVAFALAVGFGYVAADVFGSDAMRPADTDLFDWYFPVFLRGLWSGLQIGAIAGFVWGVIREVKLAGVRRR